MSREGDDSELGPEGVSPVDAETQHWQIVADAEAIGEEIDDEERAFRRRYEQSGSMDPSAQAEARLYETLSTVALPTPESAGVAEISRAQEIRAGMDAFAAAQGSPEEVAAEEAAAEGAAAEGAATDGGFTSPFFETPPRVAVNSPLRVLRVAAVTDGQVCDELWQMTPGDVHVGHGLNNKIVLHDAFERSRDHRKLAPLWLVIGLIMFLGGAGYFASEVKRHGEESAEAEAVGLQISSYQIDPESMGHGGWGFTFMLLSMIPLMAAVVGLREEPKKQPKGFEPAPKGGHTPDRHPLFVHDKGVYFIDLPPEARGKIMLGKKAASVRALRKRFGAGKTGRIRVKLGRKAKGKLLIGQTKLLFQMTPPLLPQAREHLPPEYVDSFAHLRLTPLEKWVIGATALILIPFFGYSRFGEGTDTGPPSDRFLRVMEIPTALYEEDEPEPEEEAEEAVLAVEDEKEKKVEEEEPDKEVVLAEKPKSFSTEAVEKARGVGIARVLGTYGGPGEGTVFDVIQDTENNLGELFDQGMTQTVMSSGGDVTAFVAGGKGISETGSLVQGSGLVTNSEGGAELGQTEKKEKKIRARVKSSTSDIYGDVDKKTVQATIRRRMSALQHCYEKALRTQPGLRGKMTYTITISTVGRVTKVSVEEDSLGDGSVKTCTVAKIKGWRFPSEGAEESSEVTFSVVFSGAS
jgi:hypothetical protein